MPLLVKNWEEAGVEQERSPLDPDWPYYFGMEGAGRLRIVTVRANGKLAGYAVCFVGPQTQSKSTIWGQIDTIWLHPKLRRGDLGNKLLQRAEQEMQKAGAKVVRIDASERIANWLTRKGWKARHIALTKCIGD